MKNIKLLKDAIFAQALKDYHASALKYARGVKNNSRKIKYLARQLDEVKTWLYLNSNGYDIHYLTGAIDTLVLEEVNA